MARTRWRQSVTLVPGWWQPSDREAVIETCTRVYWHIDHREWDQLAEVLDEEVELAFPDLGAKGARRPAAAIVESYQRTVAGFEATQHLLGSFRVTPDDQDGRATCRAQVQAVHLRRNPTGDPMWVLGCEHEYSVRRVNAGNWRVTGLHMSLSWATGNQHITTLGPLS
jgi:hypothetical protein